MFLFASLLKLKPSQFFLVAICYILLIPLGLSLIVLVPFLIQTLNGTPADVLWESILGDQISAFIAQFLQNTQFANGISLKFQKESLTQYIILIAFLFSLLSFLSDFLLRNYGERIAKDLREKSAIKFLSLSFASAQKHNAGFLSSLMGPLINETQQAFIRLTTSTLKEGLTAIVFVLWLIFLDYRLFVLFILIAIPAFLVLIKTSRVLKRLAKQGIQIQSNLFRDILERMRGWQTIQTYKAIPFEIARFNKLNQDMFHTWRRATRAKALGSPLVEWFAIVAACLVAVIALRRVYSGEITTPILVSFVITLGILGETIRKMTEHLNSAKQGVESYRQVLDFINSDLENREIVNFNATHPQNKTLESIEISNLSVSTPNNITLIENLSGIFEPGSFVTLIGPSGIGKTTFLNVLLGLYKPKNGQIIFDKQSTHESLYLNYASQIGFIPQEPHVFNGTVLENILYPNKITTPTETDLHKAQEALLLSNLKLDLHKDVFGLSGGEQQRLMFARIFYNKPKLIVIDEGTSALDAQNENTILQTLKTTLNSSIIFMVSHRKSVKKFATNIIDFARLSKSI